MDYGYLLFGMLALGSIAYAFYLSHTEYARKHADRLQAFALQQGFSFSATGSGEHIERLSNFHVVREGRAHKISNVLVGRLGGGTITIFEHSYIVMRALVKQTGTIMHAQNLDLPRFELQPEQSFPREYDGINFSSHPKFSGQYVLRGEDETAIRRLFDNDIVRFFENNPEFRVEGWKNMLLVCRCFKRLEVDEIPAFLTVCQNAYALFSRQSS